MKNDIIQIDLDTLKKENWSPKELENVTLLTDFVQHVMNNHDFDYIKRTYGDNPYIQHSRGIPNGMSGLVEYVGTFAKRYPEYTYDVKHIFADGDYISFHSHATLKKKDRGNDKKGFSIKDTWMIKDGKIIEHWDAIQPLDFLMRLVVLLSGGRTQNTNGIF